MSTESWIARSIVAARDPASYTSLSGRALTIQPTPPAGSRKRTSRMPPTWSERSTALTPTSQGLSKHPILFCSTFLFQTSLVKHFFLILSFIYNLSPLISGSPSPASLNLAPIRPSLGDGHPLPAPFPLPPLPRLKHLPGAHWRAPTPPRSR